MDTKQLNSTFGLISHHRGFDIKPVEGSNQLSITLEGREVGQVGSLDLAKAYIDFYHSATDTSFSLSRQRLETAQERSDAPPEPELSRSKLNAWVMWYRNASGCGLREAHQEGMRRLQAKGA